MGFKNIKTLLFENTGIKQAVLKNTFWLAIAEAIARLVQVVLIIYITRILGATEFGKFAFALSFVSVFVVLSDLGLSDITVREFSQNKKSEEGFSGILSLKILLSIGTLILMIIGSFFITPDPIIQSVIRILALFVLISNFFLIIYAFLRARQRMEYEAGAKILQALITIVLLLFIIFNFPSIKNISWGYFIASLTALIFTLVFFHFYIRPLKLSLDKVIWQKFFGLSWPLGLTAVFGAIFLNIDSVMMGYLGQITENGWYGAAERVIGLTVIPATLIWMSFYPVLSKFFKESKEKFQKVWDYCMESMIILAIPITVGGFVLSSKIINFIYNPSFSPSILALQILIFTTGVGFICSPYLVMLVVSNQQKKYLWINLIAGITNIIANIILIPLYSLYGASIAAVFTNIVLLFLAIEFSRRFSPIPLFNLKLLKIIIMAILSSLVMFIAINQSMVYNLNIIPVVIIGTIFYFFALLIFYKFLFKLNLLSKNNC